VAAQDDEDERLEGWPRPDEGQSVSRSIAGRDVLPFASLRHVLHQAHQRAAHAPVFDTGKRLNEGEVLRVRQQCLRRSAVRPVRSVDAIDEPTRETTCRMTGQAETHISTQLKKLIDLSLIERTQILNKQGRGRAYHLGVNRTPRPGV
jgi:hypothetical protein